MDVRLLSSLHPSCTLHPFPPSHPPSTKDVDQLLLSLLTQSPATFSHPYFILYCLTPATVSLCFSSHNSWHSHPGLCICLTSLLSYCFQEALRKDVKTVRVCLKGIGPGRLVGILYMFTHVQLLHATCVCMSACVCVCGYVRVCGCPCM